MARHLEPAKRRVHHSHSDLSLPPGPRVPSRESGDNRGRIETLTATPASIIKQVNHIIYTFLWKGKDKVTR